jgi:23S rRNA (cytosine1962-C5)-methyltransferase
MSDSSYALLDFGDECRLEQWGPYRLARPDPTAFGAPAHPELWLKADAVYEGAKGKGEWSKRREIPEQWVTEYDDLKMTTRLAPYKHTRACFPSSSRTGGGCGSRPKAAS